MHGEMISNAEELGPCALCGPSWNLGARQSAFGGLVQNEWDHKPRLARRLRLAADDDMDAFYFPVRGNTDYQFYYDMWSNIHYGYVGSSVDLPASTLRLANRREGIYDAADRVSVDIGISLWEKHGQELQPKHIQTAILRAVPEYVEARLHERSRFLMPWGDGI